jgi:leader peptidase (prepilin peptidase)/N-methyltransferase
MPNWLLPLILAPFIGSLASALVRRLPVGEPIALSHSRHDGSGYASFSWELVPISFVPLHARCSSTAFARLATELACIVIAIWCILMDPEIQLAWLGCVLGWTLLILALIDWRYMVLPDILTLPLVVAGLAATVLHDPSAATEHAAAACAGYLSFRAIEIGYRRMRGRDGLGQGDAKLMAAAGAWLGLAALPAVVLTAALVGLATAAASHARFHRNSALPFGPALCVAIWVGWLGLDPIAPLMEWLR